MNANELAEIEISENLIRHLHAENKELRIENERQQAKIEALKDRLKAMVIEFRQLDLPYGSKAYTSATELLWKNNER